MKTKIEDHFEATKNYYDKLTDALYFITEAFPSEIKVIKEFVLIKEKEGKHDRSR